MKSPYLLKPPHPPPARTGCAVLAHLRLIPNITTIGSPPTDTVTLRGLPSTHPSGGRR